METQEHERLVDDRGIPRIRMEAPSVQAMTEERTKGTKTGEEKKEGCKGAGLLAYYGP